MDNNEILESIRARQAETNIKYYNNKDIRRNTKDKSLASASEIDSGPTPSAPSGTSLLPSASSSANASVPLQGGTTSVGTEVVKAKEGSGPDIRYAKITTRKSTKNLRRKKINFDYVVNGSTAINKVTFATTNQGWEWLRDIKRDYAEGKLTDEDWAWYQQVYDRYNEIKQQQPSATIGKGNKRESSKPLRRTACIYRTTHAEVYMGSWATEFELESIVSGRATTWYDSHAEYRNDRSDYEDLTWE